MVTSPSPRSASVSSVSVAGPASDAEIPRNVVMCWVFFQCALGDGRPSRRWRRDGWRGELLFDGQLHVDGGLRHDGAGLVGHLDVDDGEALTLLDLGVDDLAVQERGVTGEGRVAVLGVRVDDLAPLTGPCCDVVDQP